MFDFTGGHALDNQQAAKAIFSVAALLESLGANPFRVQAYRRAALGMLRLPDEAARHTNSDGELDLPWLGPRLRRKLGELVRQGRMQFHEELLAELPRPMRELLAVPAVGPKTATRLIDELRVESVEALARAAREGRLRQLRGFGPRRERQLGLAAESLLAAAA